MTSFKQKLRDLLNNPLECNYHDVTTEENFNKIILETRRKIKRNNISIKTPKNKSLDCLFNIPKNKYNHQSSLKPDPLKNFINSARNNKINEYYDINNNNHSNLKKLFSSELQRKIDSVLKKEINKPIKIRRDDLNIFKKENLSPKSQFLFNNNISNKTKFIKYDNFFNNKTSRLNSYNKNQYFKTSYGDGKKYSFKNNKNYFDF